MIKAILIGAGDRGARAYAPYALSHPERLKFTAVAEPDKERREKFQKDHGIPDDMAFESFTGLFKKDIEADCVFVCTQDRMHFEPVMAALEKGYNVLCEKPMSGSLEECRAMAAKAREKGLILTVCHVLRYTPFFLAIKRLIEEGRIGKLVSMTWTENVAFCHYAHSFVRGNWRNSTLSNPMILAKSCHDMDLLQYFASSRAKAVSSFGSLSYFKAENAPEGAPKYCLDGCPAAEDCPYYAKRIYFDTQKMAEHKMRGVVSEEKDDEKFLEILHHSPYGKCVFRTDNNVVDNQVVAIEFENGITASFAMEACTGKWGRVISFCGTKGQIVADTDEEKIFLYDFLSDKKTKIPFEESESGHLGGDEAVVAAFVDALFSKEKGAMSTNASEAFESHAMALASEKSRLEGRVVKMNELRN
jgi:Predicted dehydrogenases and related proteins